MKLYLLKRDHHEGQTIYGVFESESKAKEQIEELKEWYPNVPESHYMTKEITLNELNSIDAHED